MHHKKIAAGCRLVALAAGMGAGMALAGPAHAIDVWLDGHPLPTSPRPIERNGRTLVPMRAIFEALGATVEYHRFDRSILARRGSLRVELGIGRDHARVDGHDTELDQAPMLYRGSTLVPLRFVSEALGAQVDWNENRQLVTIHSADMHGHHDDGGPGGHDRDGDHDHHHHDD